MLLPRPEQQPSAIVAKIDCSARGAHELILAELSTAHQGHDKAVRERPKFFSEVKRERGPTRPGTVEKPHLVVEPGTLDGADQLRNEKARTVCALSVQTPSQ